ncbi:MAG: UDP-3-O-(3-hydroxymyristoyl)glucosamine N-acyltransferase, partial [Pseudomonadota bacterium]
MHDTVAIGALAQALGLEAEGDLSLAVRSAAHPAAAGPDDLAVATDAKHQRLLAEGGARAALLDADGDLAALGLSAAIRAPRPRHALAGLTARFAAPPDLPEGVHPTAVVDPTAQLGEGVRVGPFVVIGAGVRIGAGGLIFSHVSIGRDTVVGPDALIHAGARLGHGVTLGARAILHSGCVIGADGFSFVTPEPGAVEAAKSRGASDVAGAAATVHARIHSLGGARLGDDVEVGANAAIDRGTLRDTEVGDGTKIDNLVMVGHNV